MVGHEWTKRTSGGTGGLYLSRLSVNILLVCRLISTISIFYPQKVQFEETVRCMTETLSDVMRIAQKARSDLDAELARKMAAETDVTQALLLAEVSCFTANSVGFF